MNKHGVVLDMLRDKILFLPGRCNHDSNQISTMDELPFLPTPELRPPTPPTPPPVILKRQSPPPPTYDNETDSDTSSSNKDENSKEPESIDIAEINAAAYYQLAREKGNKLFTLTMNEIYNTPSAPHTPPTTRTPRGPRVPVNKPYPCNSGRKYKRCCGSNCPIQINSTEEVSPEEVKRKLPPEYHDYLDVFDRTKADILPPHRPYDHKLEFNDSSDKTKLPKSRIYPMSGHKLEQVKKYLDEHLKKGFITPSHAPFASPVLFAEKPNGGLRFCVDYRKLNAITKRNRYPIPLIDEVLARIQGCKYLTRLDIIAAFNKLRIHPDSEDFTTFVTSLGAYKYRVLPFGLTNGPATYQQYMNDILFEYLNDFCQVYLDDILIHSKTKKEHIQHVRQILQKLRDAGLQVDILKCEFHVQKTKFLDLLVSIDGLRINPTKIQAVIE